jgi:GAF domain-containing protein/HAMP domain-containing protein
MWQMLQFTLAHLKESEIYMTTPNLEIFVSIIIILILVLGVYILIRRFSGFSLRVKLLILFLGIALIPLSVLILINNHSSQNALTEAANAALSSVAGQTGSQIDSFIEDTSQSIVNEAQLSIFREALEIPAPDFPTVESNVQEIMQVLLNKNPNYLESYALLNREGRYLTSVPEFRTTPPAFLGINPTVVQSLQISLVANLPYVSPVLLDPVTQQAKLYFAANINSESGMALGLLVATFNASILQNIIEQGNNAAGVASYGILFDENHIFLANGINPETNYKTVIPLDPSLIEKLQASNRVMALAGEAITINNPELETGLDNSREAPFFSLGTSELIDRTSQVAVHRLENRPWLVAFIQPQDIYLAPANQQTRFNLILGVVFAGITILATIGASRLIDAPISNLTVQVEKIVGGDLSIQVPVTTKDEIGRLASTFKSMTRQIQSLLRNLESQVADRTKELERRAVELQTAAEVAREASESYDLDTLLNKAVELINQRFGFYHAGIFLLDEAKEYAVLRAVNSEGGRQMLARGHQLKVGEEGIVGDTTGTGRPHIALDVGVDAAHFSNPFLPNTRSEMALPLKVGEEIIGALDVQSEEAGAFDDEDVAILQVLTDQLAVAIRNSQLLAEVRETVNELRTAYAEYTQKSWSEWSRGSRSGYRLQGTQIEYTGEENPEINMVWESGEQVIVPNGAQSTLAIPLKLRETTFGVIDLKINNDNIPEEMIELVNDIGERIAMALDNARLLEETQRSAAREQLTAEITAKIRETMDIETVLRTATTEIGRSMGLAALDIQLGISPESFSNQQG